MRPTPTQPTPAAALHPAFTPVPSASKRHDGWTPERQRDFLANLAQIGVVTAAARAVGLSPKSAYALRKRTGAESFAAAWDVALEQGRANALDTAIERTLVGTATPIFYRGRQVGERRHFNDSLLMAAMRATAGPDERTRDMMAPFDQDFATSRGAR